jgi:hypothetical protein
MSWWYLATFEVVARGTDGHSKLAAKDLHRLGVE